MLYDIALHLFIGVLVGVVILFHYFWAILGSIIFFLALIAIIMVGKRDRSSV